MSQPTPNRTPFDDDLIFDPNAPRHTQPLPQQTPPQQAQNARAVQPVLPPPVQMPPQTSTPPPAPDPFIPTRVLPPSTRAGFLMAGGALAVVVLSVAIGKLLPRTPSSQSTSVTTTQSTRTPASNSIAPPQSPTKSPEKIVMTPPLSTQEKQENAVEPKGDPQGAAQTVKSARGYELDVPDGFRLQQRGRRTLWTHRDGTKLLVETNRAEGSPRAGWEKLDQQLSKKYGARYRNLGITETMVDGREAALWEFELDLPSGTVRKLDMAIHEGGRGYAVLGSAPAARFEEARPTIERAMKSFRIAQKPEYSGSRRDEPIASENPLNNITREAARAAGDVAQSAAGTVAEAARRQVRESGIADSVKKSMKETINGAVNKAVDGAVDGITGEKETPRTRKRRENIESPQPRSEDNESESAAPTRREGY